MKKNGHSSALLVPDARGWRLRVTGSEDRAMSTLEQAVAAVPADAHLELALPCQSVLLERHKLPATDRGEIADMLQLQLEKTLPFPVDEVSHGYELLGQGDNESTILAVTAHHGQLDRICAPLRDHGRVPERITLNALRLAAACPIDETVLALWPEQEQLVVAIVAHGKLAWAQSIPSLDTDTVLTELPGLLMAAELDGVTTDFNGIRLSPEILHFESGLAAQFHKPIQPLADPADTRPELDLLPASWQYEAKSRERGEKLKQKLLIAAVAYLLLVAGAFIYLAWLKNRESKIQVEHDALKKQFAGLENQKSKWEALAAATTPPRFGVEVLHQLTRNRAKIAKPDDLQFTTFTYTPREWVLKGEGTTDAWFDFSQNLKKEKELATFDLPEPKPPYTPIPGKEDRVSFNITGKPR